MTSYAEEQAEIKRKDDGKEYCCLCGKLLREIGHNPEPICHEGLCCLECNIKKVVPERMRRIKEQRTL